jgi:hypothetical protein
MPKVEGTFKPPSLGFVEQRHQAPKPYPAKDFAKEALRSYTHRTADLKKGFTLNRMLFIALGTTVKGHNTPSRKSYSGTFNKPSAGV